MAHLLVAGKLHPAGESLLRELPARGISVDYVQEVSEPSYAALIGRADALVIRTQPLSAATIARAGQLKVVSRQKFLSEHRHDDDEDRYFARGAGVFYLHVDGKVHALYCEPGDLVSVPANTTHWFDMGTNPEFVSIRFFHDDDGWIGHFTGNPIAEVFPTFDDLHARRAQLA